MNPHDTTPRALTPGRLSSALHEAGGAAQPDYLPDIVAQARRTRQRPAWTLLERWLPMDTAIGRQGVPRTAVAFTILVLLLVLVVATVAFIGSRPSLAPIIGPTNGLIAFASGADIVVAKPDGSERRVLIRDARNTEGGMAWSPNGDRLAYWSEAPDGTFELIVVDVRGNNPVTVASGVLELTMAFPSWSPDGTTIAYSARTQALDDGPPCQSYGNGAFCTSRVFVAAADGSGARQIGDRNLDARSPDWSPDGSMIAFGGGSANPTVGVHLYVMNVDGSNVRQLSDVRGSDWAFVRVDWSHDGTKIVGQAGAAGDITEWDIWIIPTDGSEPTNVGAHDGGDEILPAWAPDRDALAWNWNGTNIVLLDEGADPLDVEIPSGLAPVWSPDGKFVAIATDDGVVLVDLRGRIVTTVDGPAGGLAWQALGD